VTCPPYLIIPIALRFPDRTQKLELWLTLRVLDR